MSLPRECLVLDEKLDRFCGQPATWWAGRLPCCDDCREYLQANNWPFGMHRIERAEVAS